tara:strand:+ start:367 stop:1047 length:681 start_codon:yes stop_codon:yes gene_type:complete
MQTRTIAYLRVSTDKQVDHGVSLEAQEGKIRAYAGLYDLDLVEIITDAGVSASKLDRPGLNKALAMLKANEADALLVVKLDRLTRSVSDLVTLIKYHFGEDGSDLMSVSESIDTRSAAGRMVLKLLSVVSEWEREAIGERTKAAMQHKKSRGEFCGGTRAPYGYRLADDGIHIEEHPGEQEVLEVIRELRGEGLSLRKIAKVLAGKGFKTRKGNQFSATQIKRWAA